MPPATKARDAAPAAVPDKNGEDKPRKSPARATFDLVFALGGALLAAFAVKWMVFDVYVIPSGSMEPAIHGRPQGGDRVLCLKFPYYFREPRRWEMAVFDFPYRSAIGKLARENERRRQSNAPQDNADYGPALYKYRNDIFIKRLVGLPGETVAIARGDLWVDAGDGKGFARPAKDYAGRRSLWVPVYAERFDRLATGELGAWWRPSGPEWTVADGILLAAPAAPAEVARLAFRSRMRVAAATLLDLPGIPDRCVFRQPVRFHCRPEGLHPYESPHATNPTVIQRPGCGARTLATIPNTQVAAHCRGCGAYLLEDAAEFYHRRSGIPLPSVIGSFEPFQGEVQRTSPLHIVTDLRLTARFRLDDAVTVAGIEFADTDRRGARTVTVRFGAAEGGFVELADSQARNVPSVRAAVPLAARAWNAVEAYIADGTAYVHVNGSETPALTLALDRGAKPGAGEAATGSGLALTVSGGAMAWDDLALDRDVHYYSGLEQPVKPETIQPMVWDQGQIRLGDDEYLFFGDNSPASMDGRTFGGVSRGLLYGPAVWMWWPPYRAHVLP